MQVSGGEFRSGCFELAVCVGILCKFGTFPGTLHWPLDSVDLGHHESIQIGAFDSS